MPLPLAHSAAAATIYLAYSTHLSRLEPSRRIMFFLALILLANSPDLDFLPGIIIDDPHRYHHGPSHSLVASFLLATLAYLALRPYFLAAKWTILASALLLTALSHPLLDLLSIDRSLPYGLPVFWPFVESHQISPYPLFPDVVRDGSSSSTFFSSLLNEHNAHAMLVEVAFSGMLLLTVLTARRYRESRKFWLPLSGALVFSLLFFGSTPTAASYTYRPGGDIHVDTRIQPRPLLLLMC